MATSFMAAAEHPAPAHSLFLHHSQENLSSKPQVSLGRTPSNRSAALGGISRNSTLPTQVDSDAGIELNAMGSDSKSLGLETPPSNASDGGPRAGSTAGFNMSLKDERKYLAVLCWCLFLAGWNDGTLGPLLPRIQEHYHIGFTIVSLLFISNCVGFVSGALANVHFSERLGFGKIIVLGSALQVVAYAIQAPAPPFPVMCVAYVINGFGIAIQDAQANAFVASVPRHQSTNMGILHAVYGVGAFAAPLVSTQFSQQPRWSFHYLVSLGVSFTNMAALIWTFKFKPQEHFIPETHTTTSESSGNHFKQIFGEKVVHALAFFIFVYVGTEVTIGGWIVTYLIDERGGGPSAGYVASGFFGGLTLGRVLLLWVNKKIGERRVIYVYSVICIALQFTVWFVPNLIGNAVAVSIVGVALGPFYPIAMNVAGAVIPRRLLAGSVGWIAGFGQAGSAVFPFMTGAMAQRHGVKVLQPLLVGIMSLTAILWFVVTRFRLERRSE